MNKFINRKFLPFERIREILQEIELTEKWADLIMYMCENLKEAILSLKEK